MKSALFALNQTYVVTKLYTLVLTFHCGVSYRKYASNYIYKNNKVSTYENNNKLFTFLPFS